MTLADKLTRRLEENGCTMRTDMAIELTEVVLMTLREHLEESEPDGSWNLHSLAEAEEIVAITSLEL